MKNAGISIILLTISAIIGAIAGLLIVTFLTSGILDTPEVRMWRLQNPTHESNIQPVIHKDSTKTKGKR